MRKRRLKDLEVREVSLADLPANQSPFLFFKARGEGAGVGGPRQGDGGAKYCICPECGYSMEHVRTGEGKSEPCAKLKCPECGTRLVGSDTKALNKVNKLKLSIESDGTVAGTRILLDGKELGKLRDFYFSYVEGTKAVTCSYSKVTATEDGFESTETFYLAKRNENMDELLEQLKDLIGDDFDEEVFTKAELSTEAVNALKGALKMIDKYKDDLPADLTKALAVLAKYASGYGYPEKKDVEKAGAKFSKDTLERIKAAVKAMEALKEVLPDDTNVSADDDLRKSIDALTSVVSK